MEGDGKSWGCSGAEVLRCRGADWGSGRGGALAHSKGLHVLNRARGETGRPTSHTAGSGARRVTSSIIHHRREGPSPSRKKQLGALKRARLLDCGRRSYPLEFGTRGGAADVPLCHRQILCPCLAMPPPERPPSCTAPALPAPVVQPLPAA